MRTGIWLSIIIALLVIIGALIGILLVGPKAGPSTTTTQRATSSATTNAGTAAGDTTDVNESGPLASRVIVTSPAADGIVSSSFTVSGQAPGGWFSEAVFPITVVDKDGHVIGSAQGQAQGEWMTNQPVAFYAQVQTSGYKGTATIVLHRDNPSGLSQNDETVTVPVLIQ